MTETVQAVGFDLDDTICEYRLSSADLLAHAFETHDVDPFFDVDDYLAEMEHVAADAANKADLRRRCFESLAEKHDYDPSLGADLASTYAQRRDHTDVVFLPGVESALDSLAEQYPLALITNGNPEMQRAKLETLGIQSLFDAIVYAGHDTPYKPDVEPFQTALNELAVPDANTIYVGDDFGMDIRGAHNAGLNTVWVSDDTPSPPPSPTYQINSMESFLSLPFLR